MDTVVVSVRVKKRVKEILEEAGVDISEEVKRYLEDLAWKVEMRRSLEELDRVLRRIYRE
ncbi:MAG: VapB-type antitoxin [Candidatus Methanodesulfokora washburnensis]|uniref:VapB-type antitoxin n=1 Tax=Candidatus Methanodesulfokora washburnensis TaxID=2478471 RepID=A0A3R9R161_9CREN|nr:VapB-type antitoxin [Candidatus Methanodesulfokores washburnensis]RSN72405.1 VapB-type antitoxin [Candidatus Methanodesulfokores washburnensis]RZN61701.1 MAG: VapB-type antitoxin [Candidatus Methanodesulfokores washburnensis]